MRSVRLGTLAAAAAVLIAGCDEARELEARALDEPTLSGGPRPLSRCKRCHGFPPAQLGEVTDRAGPHPQAAACNVCHGSTVAACDAVANECELIDGGTHMNGTVEVVAHPLPYLLQHSRDAVLGLAGCTHCHGADFAGGVVGVSCNACHASLTPIAFPDWQTNCTFCHGTRTAGATGATPLAAPPQTVIGGADPGAHQPHLVGGTISNGVACTECHPSRAGVGHANGNVEMAFGPLATANGAAATYDPQTASCTNYCHGATLPQPPAGPRPAITWAPQTLTCDSCHEGNPTTGRHPAVSAGHAVVSCGACHGGTHTATVPDRALHLNTTIDKGPLAGWDAASRSCTAVCHPQSARSWE
jgi:hypothetical protein